MIFAVLMLFLIYQKVTRSTVLRGRCIIMWPAANLSLDSGDLSASGYVYCGLEMRFSFQRTGYEASMLRLFEQAPPLFYIAPRWQMQSCFDREAGQLRYPGRQTRPVART
jgi:hypothetical protein